MPTNMSLQEFLSSAQRGYLSRILGTGSELLQKQTYLQVTNIFTDVYGRKVWDTMNNQTRYWNAVKKTAWGMTTGWRNRTDRGSGNSRPISETGSIPTIDVSNYENIYSQPRIVGTTFGVTLKAQLTAPLEGGIGDALAIEREGKARDHVKEMNKEILLSNSSIATAGGAVAQGEYFRVGDSVADTNSDTAQPITAISGDTLTGLSSADGRIVYVKSRAGITSLDDIVDEDGRTVAGVSVTNGADVYNQTTRTAGAWNTGAIVLDNNGTERDLTLGMIDTCIQNIRENGGEPNLILTGWDQYFKLQQLLQPYQRLIGQEEYTIGIGDERTLPGTRAGMTLVSYLGIPILPDADVSKGVNADDSDQGSRLYVLDTNYLEMAVLQPTQYVENRDFFQANATVVRGLYYTVAEQRCTGIWFQAKVCDLSD